MTGKNSLKKAFIGAAIVAGLAGGAAAPAAASAAAPGDVQVSACGFWVNGQGWAFYTHCTGSVYTIVQVKVVTRTGPGSLICVRPGTVGLGPNSVVSNAYYTGRLC
ncbi:DUF6355 family natural product biosynthesis protein [Actinoplanes sp. CA-252034]|uniref:DUF6355 family natural product biosynthesis protein n=1 Tax=Actinoplanes sp. CA-252034 TaxID=3239906 RepID=UPI003D95518E